MARAACLDLTTGARRVERPFPHLVFDEGSLLSTMDFDRLLAAFPGAEIMAESRRTHGSDKTYAMRTTTLYDSGERAPAAARIDRAWRGLLDWLVDSTYRTDLLRLLDIPAQSVELEIRLTEYTRGGWLSRHTDRAEKLFSQNIYLCPGWRPEWGGGLALYDGEHTAEPAAVVVPGAGTSVAFARGDRSWHEVVAVSAAAERPRRALLVHGYRPSHDERGRPC